MYQLVMALVTILYSIFYFSSAIFGVMVITQATKAKFLSLNSIPFIADIHFLKHFTQPYTMFSITKIALSKTGSLLIWKNVPLLFFIYLFIYLFLICYILYASPKKLFPITCITKNDSQEKISVQLFLDNFGALILKILVIFYKNDF